MNDQKAIYVQVGIFLLVGLIAVVVIIILATGGNFTKGHEFETYFPGSVGGLNVGSPVNYEGFTVGRVKFIGIAANIYGNNGNYNADNPDYRMITVRFSIDTSKLGFNITAANAKQMGLRVKLDSQGITGLSYLELGFVQNHALFPPVKLPWKPLYPYIPSMPGFFTQITDSAQSLINGINKANIPQLIENTDKLIVNLNKDLTVGQIHKTLASADTLMNTAKTQLIDARLPVLTAQLTKTARAFQQLAAGPETAKMLIGADALITELTRQIGPVLQNLQATMNSLRILSGNLQQYPGQTLLSELPPRYIQPPMQENNR